MTKTSLARLFGALKSAGLSSDYRIEIDTGSDAITLVPHANNDEKPSAAATAEAWLRGADAKSNQGHS